MHVMKTVAKNPNISFREFVCDTVDELSEIDLSGAAMSSTCYVIETGETYILNGKKEWKIYKGVSGSGTGNTGGAGSGSGEDFSGTVIYDGGSSSE